MPRRNDRKRSQARRYWSSLTERDPDLDMALLLVGAGVRTAVILDGPPPTNLGRKATDARRRGGV